ncbi:uromodulin-like 1 [Hypomesus transpacificus]|uniref:uromodulin-like 1 n=1 Tax=Hypomesus transpacificus TaxID=137520 RepID=UPI001F07527D|nr:uromodulin-like 1 [Hypomesus transpacificus]
MSSYNLCTGNETIVESHVASYTTLYTEKRPCGGWLPWRLCEVTLYKTAYRIEQKTVAKEVRMCCAGYEQVGSYCALPLNRSGEFTAKPGSCPEPAALAAYTFGCEQDTDCPGWQKCCQGQCTNPQPSGSQGWRLNLTVTVKSDYNMLSLDRGILNHTRLLHSMVTGTLNFPNISIFYIESWPLDPYRTSSSFLIGSPGTLRRSNTTAKLQLLLQNIEEITSVAVEDVDECVHASLNCCSAHATCNNTVGSYSCACLPGFTDTQPHNPGVHCHMVANVTHMPPLDNGTAMSLPIITHPPWTTAHNPPEESSSWSSGMPDNVTARPTSGQHSTGFVTSLAQPVSENHQNSTVASTSVDNTFPPCSLPPLTNLQSSNVTGSSFCVSWTSQSQSGQTFRVDLIQGSEVKNSSTTNQTMWQVTGLQPGVLYNVTVTPSACRGQGHSLQILVRTAAQTLEATARLTNIEFTADMLNHSSQAYQNLTRRIEDEILKSLPPEILDMVKSGMVELLITGLSSGSVVVNFNFVFIPMDIQVIWNVSLAFISSLQNSSVYTVDGHSTLIYDFDECAAGDVDCSTLADCSNTVGSYSCACLTGYTDTNPSMPGRSCEESLTITTPTALITTLNPPMTTFSPVTHTTSNIVLTLNASTSVTTAVSHDVTVATAPTMPATTTSPHTVQTPTISPVTTAATTIPVTTPATTKTTTTTTAITTATSLVSTSRTAQPSASTSLVSQTHFISVQCLPSAITVTVARQLLVNGHISDQALYLGQPGCGFPVGNTTHVQLTAAWDQCGTQIESNSSHYSAQVTLFSSMIPQALPDGSVSVPTVRLQVPILCTYSKNIFMSTGYGPTGYDMMNYVITGAGVFQLTLQLLNGKYPQPQNYSLSPDEEVVVEVTLNSTMSNITVVLNRCWVTETSNPNGIPYTFLENSCPVSGAYSAVIENGNSSRSRVSVKIFSFVPLNVIYLHCEIQICVETGSGSCKPNCIEQTKGFSNPFGTAKASCGPFLRSEEKRIDESSDLLQLVGFSFLGIGMTLFFLGAFVCVLYYHRNKIGHYNFNLKPKPESFTYNAFNA